MTAATPEWATRLAGPDVTVTGWPGEPHPYDPCHRCDPPGPGRALVTWTPLGTGGGLASACPDCLDDAVRDAVADSQPAPLAGRGARVHVEVLTGP